MVCVIVTTPYHDTNQCCDLPAQVSRFHEVPSYVEYCLVGTLPCINHPMNICEPHPPIKVNGEQEYEVEDVFDSRISNDQFQYLIHWCGYDVSEHIWEPTNH